MHLARLLLGRGRLLVLIGVDEQAAVVGKLGFECVALAPRLHAARVLLAVHRIGFEARRRMHCFRVLAVLLGIDLLLEERVLIGELGLLGRVGQGAARTLPNMGVGRNSCSFVYVLLIVALWVLTEHLIEKV